MKIFFVNSYKFDYSQDLSFAGLVSILGQSFVRDYPRNMSYHFNFKKYPKNMGFSHTSIFDFWRSQQITPQNCDYVFLGSPKPDALKSYLQIIDQIPQHTPTVLIDGGDAEEIGGDAYRLKHPELWAEIIQKRPFDFIFKREFIKNREYKKNIFPLPFCMNLEALKFTPSWRGYDKQVSFWATESHPIRTKALDLFAGQFDCDQNGTSKNQIMKHFAYQGHRYSEELSKCRIALSLRGGGWDTLRYWEIPAHGPLMISQKLNIVIPNDFEDKKSIIYCRDDLSDLLELCRYYLEHEEERLKIARASYEHLKKYHTHRARAEYILKCIKPVG